MHKKFTHHNERNTDTNYVTPTTPTHIITHIYAIK